MLRTFQAAGYVRPADCGTNQPHVLRGQADTEEEAAIFVKTQAGYGDRPAAPGVGLWVIRRGLSWVLQDASCK